MLTDLLPKSLIPENIYTPPQRKRRSELHVSPPESLKEKPKILPETIIKNETKQNTAEENATEENATEENATEENATEENAAEKNDIERNATEENATEENATKQNTKKQNAAEKNDIERNATEKNVENDSEEVVISLSSENIEHTLSLRDLRKRCIDKGLNASGKKSDLVSRLLASQ
jgi:flagellar biosynthesis GTPase FlhF